MGTWHSSQTFDLPATADGVAVARDCARSALDAHDPEVVDTVTLLISELVTNALLHARSTPRLQIEHCADSVRVTVDDQSNQRPQLRQPSRTDDQGGRGMLLVDALASSWGWEPRANGKCVWFVV